jgi:hypothetical protein
VKEESEAPLQMMLDEGPPPGLPLVGGGAEGAVPSICPSPSTQSFQSTPPPYQGEDQGGGAVAQPTPCKWREPPPGLPLVGRRKGATSQISPSRRRRVFSQHLPLGGGGSRWGCGGSADTEFGRRTPTRPPLLGGGEEVPYPRSVPPLAQSFQSTPPPLRERIKVGVLQPHHKPRQSPPSKTFVGHPAPTAPNSLHARRPTPLQQRPAA